MKPPGQDAISSTLIEVKPNESFTDETVVDETRVLVSHKLVPLSSSRMFSALFPLLSSKYRLIAPDFPRYGYRIMGFALSVLLSACATPGVPPSGYTLEESPSGLAAGPTPFATSVTYDGASTVDVPLWSPPGRAGMQPNLSLRYTSRGTDGPLGLGWVLVGASKIEKCRENPSAVGHGKRGIGYCLDGSLLLRVGATAEYRTDVESFRLIQANFTTDPDNPDSWTVKTPKGQALTYKRLTTEPRSNKSWRLARVEDEFSNYMTYSYNEEELLETISYTGNTHLGLNPRRSVRLFYEPRSAVRSSLAFGAEEVLKSRMVKISMWAPGGLSDAETDFIQARTYKLKYRDYANSPNDASKLDVLQSITECAGTTIESCKDPIVLTTTTALSRFEPERVVANAAPGKKFCNFRIVDLSGNGRPHLLYTEGEAPSATFPDGWCGFGNWFVRRATFENTPPIRFENTGIPLGIQTDSENSLSLDSYSPMIVDVDGDGIPEIVGACPYPSAFLPRSYPNKLKGLCLYRKSSRDFFFYSEVAGYWSQRLVVADFDGDGRPDFVDVSTDGTLMIQWNCSTPSQFCLEPAVPWMEEKQQATRRVQVDINVPPFIKTIPVSPYSDARRPAPDAIALDIAASAPPLDESVAELRVDAELSVIRFAKGYTNLGCQPVDWHCQTGLESFVIDINGDGLQDLLFRDVLVGHRFNYSGSSASTTLGNPISARIQRGQFAVGRVFAPSPVGRMDVLGTLGSVPFDANGDGYLDLFLFHRDGNIVRGGLKMNDGLGHWLGYSPVYERGDVTRDGFAEANEIVIMDVDLDGRDDIIDLSHGRVVTLQPYGNWSPIANTTAGEIANVIGTDWGQNRFTNPGWSVRVGDMSGDTIPDLFYIRNNTTVVVREHAGDRPGLITQIQRSNRFERFSYSAINSQLSPYTPAAPGSCNGAQTCVTSGLMVVATHQVLSNDPATTSNPPFNTQSFSYFDGRSDSGGRGWLGFAKRIVQDEAAGSITESSFGVDFADRATCSTNNCSGRYLYPYSLMPRREVKCLDLRESTAVGGSALCMESENQVVYAWEGGSSSEPIPWLKSSTTTTVQRELQLSAGQEAVFDDAHVSAARPLRTSRISRVLASGAETQSVRANWLGGVADLSEASLSQETITFVPLPDDLQSWHLGLPETMTIESKEAAVSQTRKTRYEYKTGSASIWKVIQEPDASIPQSEYESEFRLTRVLDRDAAGNVRRVRSFSGADIDAGRAIAITYDADFMFPISRSINVSPSLSLTAFGFHEISSGVLAVSDDFNGLRTTRNFDVFGRLTSIWSPGSEAIGVSRRKNNDGLLEIQADIGWSSGPGAISRIDAFGRQVSVEWPGWSGNRATIKQTFDRWGHLSVVAQPFFVGQPSHSTTMLYDKAGRVVEKRFAHGGVDRIAYGGLSATYYGNGGANNIYQTDQLGRIVSNSPFDFGRPDEATRNATTFKYAPFGALREVISPAQDSTIIERDILGRIRSVSDGDTGTTTFYHDAFGMQKGSVDARGAKLQTRFDLLGRPITRTLLASGGAAIGANGSVSETIDWDTAPAGRGEIARVRSMDDVVTELSYDASTGRATAYAWTIPGLPRQELAYSYAMGRLSELTYPDGFVVRYEYGNDGSIERLRDKRRPFWRQIFEVNERNAAGQVLSETFGDSVFFSAGVRSDRVFDEVGRLKSIKTTHREWSSPFNYALKVDQHLTYTYSDGWLRARGDEVLGIREEFGHDFRGLLTSWKVDQAVGGRPMHFEQVYAYNANGNMSFRYDLYGGNNETTSIFDYPRSGGGRAPNLISESRERTVPNSYFAYDLSGNQTERWIRRPRSDPSSLKLDWTYFNMPRSVEETDLKIRREYSYDGNRNRVLTKAPGFRLLSLGGLYQELVVNGASTAANNILFEGRTVAQRSGTGESYSYIHADILGSPDYVSGAGLQRNKFSPYGERRSEGDVFNPTPAPATKDLAMGFSGHSYDPHSNLTDMGGRIYDQQFGRFLSADPFIPSKYEGRAYNRYIYAYGNPLRFTDPTGFDPDGGISGSYYGEDWASFGGFIGFGIPSYYSSSSTSASPSGSSMMAGSPAGASGRPVDDAGTRVDTSRPVQVLAPTFKDAGVEYFSVSARRSGYSNSLSGNGSVSSSISGAAIHMSGAGLTQDMGTWASPDGESWSETNLMNWQIDLLSASASESEGSVGIKAKLYDLQFSMLKNTTGRLFGDKTSGLYLVLDSEVGRVGASLGFDDNSFQIGIGGSVFKENLRVGLNVYGFKAGMIGSLGFGAEFKGELGAKSKATVGPFGLGVEFGMAEGKGQNPWVLILQGLGDLFTGIPSIASNGGRPSPGLWQGTPIVVPW